MDTLKRCPACNGPDGKRHRCPTALQQAQRIAAIVDWAEERERDVAEGYGDQRVLF